MTDHQVASREEWQAAREELLKREKEHTRTGDVLARQRRELPGSRSTRSTGSTPRTGRGPWPSYSTAARS
jgi:predicted dithiol-disulfide oxidoreductase (DUF899 family)